MSDSILRELESAVEADFANYDSVRKLSNYCRRIGWRHLGRTLDEWAELAKNQQFHEDPFRFIEVVDDLFFCARNLQHYRELGAKIVPLLFENFQSSDLALKWNALACLGFIGPASLCVFDQILAEKNQHVAIERQLEWFCRGVGRAAMSQLVELLRRPDADLSRLIRLLSIFGEQLIAVDDDIRQCLRQRLSSSDDCERLLSQLANAIVKENQRDLLEQVYIGDAATCSEISRQELDWFLWCYKQYPFIEDPDCQDDEAADYLDCWRPEQIQLLEKQLIVRYNLFCPSQADRMVETTRLQQAGFIIESTNNERYLEVNLLLQADNGESFTSLELAHKVYAKFGTHIDFAGHSMGSLSFVGHSELGLPVFSL